MILKKGDIIQNHFGAIDRNNEQQNQIMRENKIPELVGDRNPVTVLEEINPTAYKLWMQLEDKNNVLRRKITSLVNQKKNGFSMGM